MSSKRGELVVTMASQSQLAFERPRPININIQTPNPLKQDMTQSDLTHTARANSNIALVKYWGKRNVALNLPGAGSISMTLSGLETTTKTQFDPTLQADILQMNGKILDGKKAGRLSIFLDRVREMANLQGVFARVETDNNFPTAAGLASSASGFAALATSATRAAGLDLNEIELSILARIGSGSAARSIYGGFVEMHVGQKEDGTDAYATPLAGPEHWDLRCVVAVCAEGEKPFGSTEAMEHTSNTSPFYQPWIDDVPQALDAARDAIARRDFEALAPVAEASCLRMHASAMAADPGILYWKGATVDLIHSVRQWRKTGLAAFFTIDAGPHVKVFCTAEDSEALIDKLRAHEGVLDVLVAAPGPGVRSI